MTQEIQVISPEEMGESINLQSGKYEVNLKTNGGLVKDCAGQLEVDLEAVKTQLPKVTGLTFENNNIHLFLANQDVPELVLDISGVQPVFNDDKLVKLTDASGLVTLGYILKEPK